MLIVHCPCVHIFEVPYIDILQLCSHFVLQAINIDCNSIKWLQTFYLKSLQDLFCAYPRISPPHTIRSVISSLWLVLDLVLVFVGFGLFQICSHLLFSPHSKDHVLQRMSKLSGQPESTPTHSSNMPQPRDDDTSLSSRFATGTDDSHSPTCC
jgi:hypothetical protein